MSLEITQNNFEEENDPLFEFKEKLKERSKGYIDAIEHFQRLSRFPRIFQQFKDEIDAEEKVCLLRVEQMQKELKDKFTGSFEDYSKRVNPLFEIPVNIMEEQTKAIEILLSDRPFDVIQEEYEKLTADIDTVINKHSEDIELTDRLLSIRRKFDEALFKVYEATNARAENLHNHFRAVQKNRSLNTANEINRTVEQFQDINQKIENETRASVSVLMDTYGSNCMDIVDKAFNQLKSEQLNAN